MKLKGATIIALGLFAVVYSFKPASADIYCERELITNYKVGPEDVTKTTHQRFFITPSMLKIEEVESGETIIVRLDSKLVLKFNTVDKSYTQSDFQALTLQLTQEKMSDSQRQPQVGLGQDAVKKQMMQSMPVEQRGIMEEMMQAQMAKMKDSMTTKTSPTGGGTGPAELKPTPDTKTMLGYKVKRLKVVQTVEGQRKKIIEMWVNPDLDPKNYFIDFVE